MQLTFLQLCQTAYRESGFVGSITSVLNQTGRAADVVRWVGQAYEALQLHRTDWNVDWARGTFDLIAGKDTYDPILDWGVAGGIKRFERKGAYLYRPAAGLASRQWLGFYDWAIARDLTPPVVPGFPTAYSRLPDGKVFFYPQPAEALKMVAEYWRWPQVLTADGELPRIAAAYHMAIVWRAVMEAADFNKDWARKDTAEERYYALVGRMERGASPHYLAGGPLA